MHDFNFDNLFVLDLANNHQGSVEHGLNIIKQLAKVVKKRQVKAGIKFQFRELETFVHGAHKKNSDNKHIPRFLGTRLTWDEFRTLKSAAQDSGFLTICTPFCEASVDVIDAMNFDIIKVASCSAKDWPLLEKIASVGMPTIVSTGGLALTDIDNIVSFFDHRGVDFGLMHCVSIYPTAPEHCQLNQIDLFKARYPQLTIGWSTHESPDELGAVQVAVAKGAKMFERHVGLVTDQITLNAYSSTPEQIDQWIGAYQHATALCGQVSGRPPSQEVETVAINGLKRGVFAKELIPSGAIIMPDQVYFAMPYQAGQLSSGEYQANMTARQAIKPNEPLLVDYLAIPPMPEYRQLKSAVHEVKALLNLAKIPLNSEFVVEYSHHYGAKAFAETGAVIINCINRAYCKKLIVQLPSQKHPEHYHERKEETFQVLYGQMHVRLNGLERILHPGETCLVQPGVWHSFWTDTGCIFEEVSTTHYNDDSFYRDKKINQMPRHHRKTVVDHWGRNELQEKAEQAAEMDVV